MKRIFVDADWAGPEPLVRRVGTIEVSIVRGQEVASFSYDPRWLESRAGVVLDPLLPPAAGPRYFSKGMLPGLMHDSAPDRWGRMLIRRREALEARREGRSEKALTASDYLLGVSDAGRIGGLRFKTEEGGSYLAEPEEHEVPPLAKLRALEGAVRRLEAGGADSRLEESLALLLAPGSSLGGARPKATVADPEGNLWVAKFPSRRDEWDVGAWEALTYRLAERSGLRTAPSNLLRVSTADRTFLLRRFDRQGANRVHFASAMCLLGCQDGDGAASGIGYLDLAALILRCGSHPREDLEELWRRIVFNILVRNTDDHLRNHGFLLGETGWRLSPVYDVNPQPDGMALALNISESDNSASLDLALAVAESFRLTTKRREEILRHCRSVVASWRDLALQMRLKKTEIGLMASAFGS